MNSEALSMLVMGRRTLIDDLGGKSVQCGVWMFPRFRRQARLTGRLRDEGCAIPAVLHRYLREQQTPCLAELDDESVSAYLDLTDILNAGQWRENRDLDLELRDLVQRNRRETQI